MRDGFVFADGSQLHVGGYTSYIFVRPTDGATWVLWLSPQYGTRTGNSADRDPSRVPFSIPSKSN